MLFQPELEIVVFHQLLQVTVAEAAYIVALLLEELAEAALQLLGVDLAAPSIAAENELATVLFHQLLHVAVAEAVLQLLGVELTAPLIAGEDVLHFALAAPVSFVHALVDNLLISVLVFLQV